MSGFHPIDLIKLVKARPPLYNRDLLEHPRKDHKHQLWLEVAENLTPPEDWIEYSDVEKDATIDQIQAKWKHLKDHFHRELKLIDSGEAHTKRRYVYFEDMEFMRPFVGYKVLPAHRRVTKMESIEFTEQNSMCHDTDVEMDSFVKTCDEYETELPTKRPKNIPKSSPKQTTHLGKKLQKGVKKVGPKCTSADVLKLRDPDVTFCLSLVPNLRKLTDSKKLLLKMEILKVLYTFVELNENTFSNPSKSIEHEEDPEMQEDHLDDMDGDGVYIKHEEFIESFTDNGNTKTWWT